MTWLLVACCAGLGLVVGSFLNVVIQRVPRSEPVLRSVGSCPGCGAARRLPDRVPVLSWLLSRGRCRGCGQRIPVRDPLVELATSLAFGGVAHWFGFAWTLPAYLYLTAVSIALTIIDVDVRRLPDAIVKPSYLVAGVLLTGAAVAGGSPELLVGAAAGGFAMFAFYFIVATVYPAAMGGGDVKLAGLLGLFLGFLGWPVLASGALLAFLIGGMVGIAFVLTGQRRRRIPFGPFMIAGAWLGIVAGPALVDWYLGAAQLA